MMHKLTDKLKQYYLHFERLKCPHCGCCELTKDSNVVTCDMCGRSWEEVQNAETD